MRVLLVSPTFHEYWKSISFGFESLGHSVETIVYDALPGPGAKMGNKITIEIPEKLGADRGRANRRRATSRVAEALTTKNPDVVVVIKGDLLDPALWDPFRHRGIPVVLWLYDELSRMRHTDATLTSYTAVATYSPADCTAMSNQHIVSKVVPMAFDERLVATGELDGHDLVFVGARYPSRMAMLIELSMRGVPVRAYGRDWSHRVVDRIRTLHWSRPDVPGAPDVSREEAAHIMHRAPGILNVHGDGDGFNPRTFEACGVGGVQLIDRPDVEMFYEPDRELLVFKDADEAAALFDRVRGDRAWASRIRDAGRGRTLAQHTYTHRCTQLLDLC